MYRRDFATAYGILGILAAGALASLLIYLLATPGVRVVRRTVPTPALTADSSAQDVRARFGGLPDQSVPGEDVGLTGTCDAYLIADGAVLVCHL